MRNFKNLAGKPSDSGFARCLMLGVALATLGADPGFSRVVSRYKDIFSFDQNGADEQRSGPYGSFVQAQNGKLYGAVNISNSKIYEIGASGSAGKVVWGSDAETGDVCGYAMALGPDGALYGTCTEWGNNVSASGAVFRFNPSVRKNNFTLLYTFPAVGESRTIYPSPLTLGPDGNFYGTTQTDGVGYGTVFQITAQGAFTVIHSFQGGANDGALPSSGGTYVGNAMHLTLGSDGNFYGTTDWGGANNNGTIYQVTTSGAVTVLYSFPGGYCGCSGVTELNGNFYGLTIVGGTNNQGTLFEFAGGTLTTLHNFDETTDSAECPNLPLTLGSDGNLYGASPSACSGGYNTESLFRITPSGTYTDLYNGFGVPDQPSCGTSAGCFENAPLYQATNGRYYGVANEGGSDGDGTVFDLTVRGSAPFVRPILPVATPGQWLGILGQGFNKATDVAFNGEKASFRVVSDTYLEARVPSDAARGRITVRTDAGELRSNIDFNPLR